MEDDRRLRAFREAGHAVYLEHIGWPVRGIGIADPEDDSIWFTETVSFDATDFPYMFDEGWGEFQEQVIQAILAGYVAVEMAGGPALSGTIELTRTIENLGEDFIVGQSLLDLFIGKGLGKYESWPGVRIDKQRIDPLWIATAQVLQQKWPAVERTAGLLLSAGWLTGRDVRAYIRDLDRPQSEWLQPVCIVCGRWVPRDQVTCDDAKCDEAIWAEDNGDEADDE